MFKKILIGLLLLVIAIGVGVWFWLRSFQPAYQGDLNLKGLNKDVDVFYDNYGVPHIYAQNEEDAYTALGYVIAQDRFFQLELIRRLASGRLSEILGYSLIKTDKFFRTIGLKQHAEWSAKEFLKSASPQVIKSTQAYVKGVNEFIDNGKMPIEFTILGIEREKFKLEDIFLISGYMSLGFAEGFRHDPMIEAMAQKVGPDYMRNLNLGWPVNSILNKTDPVIVAQNTNFSNEVNAILENFPVSPWNGSNSWVLAPSKTKSKKTLFCNDTHMGYSQPAVWYEAHLEYPGFKFYGNFLAGFPFALVGHNDFCANGLTMFENDDADFYYEEREGDNVKFNGEWTALKFRNEEIKVKDASNIQLKVAESPHGPIINKVFETFPTTKQDVAIWWSYLKFPSRNLEATYKMNHAKSMDEAKTGASMIDAPGLNVMYGDKDGNIAWWASAKLVKRRAGIQSKKFLNGASGQDEPLGWYPFEKNPHAENPSSGYVYSANGQPDSISLGILYPGYYVPENRALEIVNQLQSKNNWDVDEIKKLITNSKSTVYEKFSKKLLEMLGTIDPEELKTEAANRLSSWEGEHGLESVGAVIYYRWIYYILKLAMEDDLGKPLFNSFMNTHFMKTAYPDFINTYESAWWEDKTTDKHENRTMIIKDAWYRMKRELSNEFGKEVIGWKWKRVHKLEHVHPIGRKKPFNLIFNVGPNAITGGNEVINNTGFNLDSSGMSDVKFGPAMRRIIDFADIDHSYSILPTGQSGYFMAPHYSDQSELYNSNGFRMQLMDKKMIEQQAGKPLKLKALK